MRGGAFFFLPSEEAFFCYSSFGEFGAQNNLMRWWGYMDSYVVGYSSGFVILGLFSYCFVGNFVFKT